MLFFLDNLQIYQMSVSLQRVFHSIRFKVNKGWVKALTLFLCPYVPFASFFHSFLFSQHHLFIVRRSESGMLLERLIKMRNRIKSTLHTDLRNIHIAHEQEFTRISYPHLQYVILE